MEEEPKSLEQLYMELAITLNELDMLFETIKDTVETDEQKKEAENLQKQFSSTIKVVK